MAVLFELALVSSYLTLPSASFSSLHSSRDSRGIFLKGCTPPAPKPSIAPSCLESKRGRPVSHLLPSRIFLQLSFPTLSIQLALNHQPQLPLITPTLNVPVLWPSVLVPQMRVSLFCLCAVRTHLLPRPTPSSLQSPS